MTAKKRKPVAVLNSTENYQRLKEEQERSWVAVAKVQERYKDPMGWIKRHSKTS